MAKLFKAFIERETPAARLLTESEDPAVSVFKVWIPKSNMTSVSKKPMKHGERQEIHFSVRFPTKEADIPFDDV